MKATSQGWVNSNSNFVTHYCSCQPSFFQHLSAANFRPPCSACRLTLATPRLLGSLGASLVSDPATALRTGSPPEDFHDRGGGETHIFSHSFTSHAASRIDQKTVDLVPGMGKLGAVPRTPLLGSNTARTLSGWEEIQRACGVMVGPARK